MLERRCLKERQEILKERDRDYGKERRGGGGGGWEEDKRRSKIHKRREAHL